jgi:uroporphyrinogen decarboxylase
VNVMNLQQPRALGIEEIGRRYAGRMAFSSLCDIQSTLPHGVRAAIREDARLLLQHWATPRGGFVLQDYHDGAAIGAPPAARQMMLDAFREFDPWRAAGETRQQT